MDDAETKREYLDESELVGLVRKAYEKKYGKPLPRITVQDVEDWEKNQ